jgi:axial budding pattern protein 2
MTYSILPWAVLLLVGLAAATPAVTFPINSQVPPVARIGKLFSFAFSSSTFSPSSDLTYTLSKAPQWLSIDSKTRRIYGTPAEQDVAKGEVVGVPFELEASDATGSASMSVTLVVCRHAAPAVQIPLVDQGLDFAPLSQPSSFIMGPNEAFAFSLSLDTFSDPAALNLSYYAVMADNTPLPAWIAFEESTLSFSGTTPALEALIQTPQAFSFQLVASDVVGFSGASLPFSIVVGNHEITADNTNIVLNATVGKALSYSGLSSSVKFDGKDAKSSNITFSTSGMPTWLTVDKKSWEISGTPTTNAKSSNFTITMQDQYSDTLNITISIQMSDGLFTGTLPQLNLTAGGRLDFDLTPYVNSSKAVKVWIETSPNSTWVSFDTSSKRIYGDVPQSRTNSSLVISVHAQSTTSSEARVETMTAHIRGANTQQTATMSEEPTATSTSSSDPEADSRKKSNTRTILLAVLLPVLFVLLIAACLLVFCCRKRRQKRTSSIDRRDISRPVPGSPKADLAADSGADVASLDTIYEADYSEHPSEVHLGRDPYGQLYSRPGFLTPPPSRDGKKHDSNGMRLVNPSWAVVAPDTPTPPPRARMQLSDDTLPDESQSVSRPTTSGRQHLEVEIPSFSIFSNQQTPESAYFHSLKPNCATDTPRASSDRSTALEDFMQDYLYSPESRPDSSGTYEASRPPPLTASGHRQRPPFPRRLFADGLARPGTSSLRSHDPAAPISPPDSEDGDLPRTSLSQVWSSEDMDENAARRRDAQDQEQAEEALMTTAAWPTPPHVEQQQGEAVTTPTAAHIRLVSDASASEVDEWVGTATSQYSKASDWMEAVSTNGKGDVDSYSSRGGSLDERRRRRSENPGMSRPGTGRSSGDYPVFI